MQKFITVNLATATAQHKLFEGRPHLVVPVVAIKAGVLNGELVLAEEISKFVQAWDGIPLPVHHPQKNGVPVSANSVENREQSLGYLFNTDFIGNSLKGEMWLDIAKAQRLGGDALAVLTSLDQGTLTEVSTGYYCDMEKGQGVFNGLPYDGIQRNIRPNHLALLPGAVGACSIEDGCGAPRVNQLKDQTMTFLQKAKAKLFGDFHANIEKAFAEIEAEEPLALPVATNSTQSSSTVLPAPGPQGEPAVAPPPPSLQQATAWLVHNNTVHRTNCDCSVCEQHVNQEVHMDKKELVSNVLRIQKRPETERALYDALPDDVLKTLAVEPVSNEPKKKEEGPPVDATSIAAVVNAAVKEAFASVPTINADMLDTFSQFSKLSEKEREQLTAYVTTNAKDYSKEECNGMSMVSLRKLAQNIGPVANYGGRAFPQNPQTNEQHTSAPEPPPLIELKQQAA